MMATTFVVFVLFAACSYALPLKSTLFVVPVFVQKLNNPQALITEESMYASNDGAKVSNSNPNIEKRSAEEADSNDLETAAGTNVLRPLFVYRQQIAYRQRARDAIRRGRRI
ncbi:hypothetical protein PUN28_013255 [Cardiocondyla obscurior]|uniref:Uncharacterized protein n=1 Tax=Cardiocondyla obscurior TaxID=286306 RepID=A0AAW2FAZ0_9HYME